MSLSAKQIVKQFYKSDLLKDDMDFTKYHHKELVLIWNSSDGLTIMNYDDVIDFYSEIKRTYNDLRIEISHLLEDDNHVTVRYKYYIRTIENPEEELGISHFIAIWEIKDDKMYRGYLISQPVTGQDDTSESYHKVKV